MILHKSLSSRAKNINGANLVHCTIAFDMTGPTGSTFTARSENTRLPDLLDYCKTIGIDTSVRCHVGSANGVVNKNVNPANVAEWFSNWKQIILDTAEIASQHGAKYLGIENELLLMTRDENKEKWQDIQDAVKTAYPELQTFFSCSVEEYELGCCLVGMTDINGINLYPLMTRKGLNESDDNLRAAWFGGYYNGRNYIAPLSYMKSNYPNKQLWVIETGCGASSTALEDPARFDLWASADLAPEVQEKYYQILFEVLWSSTIDAMGIWAIGSSKAVKGYSYQYHPAENIVNKNWKGV